jgi:DNA-binding XRE family transcriptional regulator
MSKRVKSTKRELTQAQQDKYAKLRKQLDAEKSDIMRQAKAFFNAQEESRKIVALLKAERVRQGLSLADIQERTGITRGAISVLENADDPNPTIHTLQKYAQAVGARVELVV